MGLHCRKPHQAAASTGQTAARYANGTIKQRLDKSLLFQGPGDAKC